MENNSALMNEVRDVYKLQLGRDKFPKAVIPVCDVNPKHARITNIVRSGSRSITGAGTIYTTPATQDFYLTYAVFTLHADATADNTTAYLQSTIDGTTRQLLGLAKLSATAYSQSVAVSFDAPIKLDRNATIQITSTFTVGASISSAVFGGFIVDNSNA